MTARIYRQSPSVTQSGPGSDKPWRLDFDLESPRSIEPLMGWTSSADMKQQIRLRFVTKEEAVAYAERTGIPYRVEEPKADNASRRTASYSDNFRTNRIGLWTH
ncbi:MAG: ETC complex I subunit [Hyphomicrobiales bacterium]|nr:MAG: ETC complex I subunit [Hyphomicrobiales bacterium]